jgi:hypothetical protein
MRNVGKCRFTRAVIHYILLICIRCWHNCSLSGIKKSWRCPTFQVFTCSCHMAFTRADAQQPAALTQRTVAAMMIALFAFQTDQICAVTFLHCHLSRFSPTHCSRCFIYIIHVNYKTNSFMLDSSFTPIEEFAQPVRTETCVETIVLK